jgi:hypothetical protein
LILLPFIRRLLHVKHTDHIFLDFFEKFQAIGGSAYDLAPVAHSANPGIYQEFGDRLHIETDSNSGDHLQRH